ncbi:fungal-specific transcription factor domain-containing protein [Stachybotrys elegans]|uniref:Fungal-specific transcription factor domain-containing protein n=1 Tax=Stachybotrys elegans TaxID=80388 RepID=A0A8K0SKY3_9HYPO|nr:fungal-specific transcription factor domain-containing protein [Stachybotrys elegans]
MQPLRKNITRSRNGCAVCKSKRLKCDEARPYCSRCTRLGIPCPGYKKQIRWAKGSEASTASTSSTAAAAAVPSPTGATAVPPLDTDDTVDQSYAEFEAPNLFHNFANVSYASDDLTISSASPSSQLPCLPMSDAPYLQQQQQQQQLPSPSYVPSTPSSSESQEHEREGSWLESLNGAESERSVVIHQKPRYQHRTVPVQQPPPLPQALQDHSTVLVEYYFKEVCGMMSCYDSTMNPYRTTVSGIWTFTPSLYCIMQSMAAACLSEVSPGLAAVGRRLEDNAVTLLAKDVTESSQLHTSSLMALVMLGFSMSWHNPKNLGEAQFQLLSKALATKTDDHSPSDSRKKFFFYNSLVYWKLLLSFASDADLELPPSHDLQPQSVHAHARRGSHVPPHPQTGIGVEVQELVAQVGCLARKERRRIRSRRWTSRRDNKDAEVAIQTAERLHIQLCSVKLPTEASILDPGDNQTATIHLLKVAEAYRIIGLIQLYRNFPDLLNTKHTLDPISEESQHLWAQTGGISEQDHLTSSSEEFKSTFLTGLALHVVNLIQDIPTTSRSISIQPLLCVSICSELSLSRTFCPSSQFQQIPVPGAYGIQAYVPEPSITGILHARRAVLNRLASCENILAARPIRQMLQLVKETWSVMDACQHEVYWMDVMMERQYETLMG